MDQIEEVKKKTDIVALISERLPLKKAGRNFRTTCPFHNEKTPSFMVSPEMQIFKCFGCSVGGDAIKFLQLYERMDFWEAVEFLAKKAGIKLVRRQMTQEEQVKTRLYQVNNLAAEFYHFLLTKHKVGKKALDYVLSRGIKAETIEHFRLGFAPNQRNALTNFLKKKGYTEKEMEKSGLVFFRGQNNYSSRFFGRLVFPLLNHREMVVGFSGRVIPGVSLSDNPKYINSPETLTYHKGENLYGLWLTKQEIRKTGKTLVVEGEFDVISAFQAGFKNIVAIKGTAFTEDQARLINRFAETAILALDTDMAGSEAIKRSSQVAEKVGLNVKVLVLPKKFKDLDEIIQKDPNLFKKVLDKTVPVWDFLISLAVKKNDPADPIGKKGILTEVLPFLVQIENEVIKDHYLQKLAEVLRVSLESVLMEAAKTRPRKTVTNFVQPSSPTTEADRQKLLEKQLLILVFAGRHWQLFKETDWVELISAPLLKKIVSTAVSFFKEEKKPKINAFFNTLPAELKKGFEDIYLKAAEEGLDSSEKELNKVLAEIKKENLRFQLSQISSEISRFEKAGKPDQVKKKENQFVEISRLLATLENE